MRSGHTEACIDLCKLAGHEPVGVLSELVNDDGTVMRGPQVAAFARKHKLVSLSVADLIAYRQRSERLVERLDSFPIQTPHGPAEVFTYSTPFDPMHHLALVFGDIGDGRSLPVRLQLEEVAEDVFGASRRMDRILEKIANHGRGIIVYLREGAVGVARSGARTRQSSLEGEDHASAQARGEEWREIGLGAQILNDLGVQSIRLIASRERHYVGLSGFGIVIEKTGIFDA